MLLTHNKIHHPNDITTFKAKHVRGAVRQISCTEAKCQNKENGWMVVLSTPAQQDAIDWVKAGNTGRHFKEKIEQAGLVTFIFSPGQDCFNKHWQREPVFDIGRKEAGRVVIYPDGDAFVEDSDKHLRKLKEAING